MMVGVCGGGCRRVMPLTRMFVVTQTGMRERSNGPLPTIPGESLVACADCIGIGLRHVAAVA